MLIEYYNILELSPGATPDEIKSAYKRLAIKYHPDKNDNYDAEEKFKKISEAYQYLINIDNNSCNNFSNISPEDIFNEFFKINLESTNISTSNNVNININNLFSNILSQSFMESNNSNIQGYNNISRQSNINIQNGKRIEHIVEIKNGIRSERTIITDLNSRLFP